VEEQLTIDGKAQSRAKPSEGNHQGPDLDGPQNAAQSPKQLTIDGKPARAFTCACCDRLVPGQPALKRERSYCARCVAWAEQPAMFDVPKTTPGQLVLGDGHRES
jgi:hypothetical protein